MSDSTDLSPIAQALGRVPSGLFLLTTMLDDAPIGLVASFVMQQGFEPPTLSVAVGKDRDHLKGLRDCGRFAISVFGTSSGALMKPFFKQYEGQETPFDHVVTKSSPSGLPVLTESLAWLECKVSGEHSVGDHVVVFGTVVAGEKLDDGDPTTHVRANGLGY